jgi:hypothetical protein
MTPYGSLYINEIPLPDDVVIAMSKSIIDIKSQLRGRMTLVSTQTSFSIGVTEDDPMIGVGSAVIRNDGGFGSYLSVSTGCNCQWLTIDPSNVQSLAQGSCATFNFSIDPSYMHSSDSPYTGQIVIKDINDCNSTLTFIVNVVVLPRPVINIVPNEINLNYYISNPGPYTQYMNVVNSGLLGSILNFEILRVSCCSPWLKFFPNHGGPLSSGEFTQIEFSTECRHIQPTPGTYREVMQVKAQNAKNSPVYFNVNLNVLP